jgi:uncharacterized protein YndB with AHSA1/START domain
MDAQKKNETGTADREIVVERTYDAPRDLVYTMWTNPKHIVRWWGPAGFTNTIQEMDVRPGGAWRHIMHGPNGVDYKNEATYTEVVRPERLGYEHVAPRFLATVTFTEAGGRTAVQLRMVFPTAELRDRIVKEHHAIEGGKQTLGRLADHLASIGP